MTDKRLSAATDSLPRNFDWGACLAAHEHWLRKVIYARTGERLWSDRRKRLDQFLFPGYVFCRINIEHRLPVLTTPGVVGSSCRDR